MLSCYSRLFHPHWGGWGDAAAASLLNWNCPGGLSDGEGGDGGAFGNCYCYYYCCGDPDPAVFAVVCNGSAGRIN